WADDAGRREASPTQDWFDVVVESAVEGLRKPDPRIYRLVCIRLEVAPSTAVFLDDLGANLKPARELGMTTIKVAEPDAALAELESVLGFALSGGAVELLLIRHAQPVCTGARTPPH